MLKDNSVRFGFGLCVIGFLIALSSLLPAVAPKGSFNWLVIAGSAVYLPGAFLAFMSAKKQNRNQVFMWLRVVRMGFIGIRVIWMALMTSGVR